MKNTKLPPELQAAWEEIEGYARAYGLDFFPIIYEVLDYRTLYETAAMQGFPTRYPHWRFGMDYDQLLKGHIWMGSTIYEMVINTNPSYAYLLEGNETVTQKMVMAHVTGHVDFFKNNMWFAHTNRKMLDEMANHATRIQRLIDRYGYDLVEDFIDTCLSLDNLIDYHAPYIKRPEAQTMQPIVGEDEQRLVEGLKVEREYMRDYINPPDFLERERKKLDDERLRQKRFPENPQKDILLFLLNYAPLERWQHTILEIIRDEAYYFAPQGMTKIINEGWACVVAGSLLFTAQGLLPIEDIVQQRLALSVGDGEHPRRIYDWATFTDRETVWMRTRRGFEVEGSVTHRLRLPDGEWRRLDELQVGDQVQLGAGQNLWATEYLPIAWQSQSIPVPALLDERVGAFLGYLLGAGYSSELKRTLGLTTSDAALAANFATLLRDLFAQDAQPHWEAGRYRVSCAATDLADLLKQLGVNIGVPAQLRQIPDAILRSPKSVVVAFLRAYADSVGSADDDGLLLSTDSEALGRVLQLLLLNFGILTTRRSQSTGTWHVAATGASAALFLEQIGFGLHHKQQALHNYVALHPASTDEEWCDAIVAMQRRRADVYDISVEETHRYAAQGFINHNSYWHSTIMTQKALQSSEIISFADLHSGVVATGGGRLNPYKLGLELLRDIEDRWNKGKFGKEYEECEDIAEKRTWDRQLGLGRQKIFEVRRLYNDVTFIDEFLTPEFVMEHKLFTFRYNRDTDLYEIASREFKEVKEKLLFRLTNFGQPFIYVEDANYNNRGELYLRHRHEGVDLKMDYARDTMRNLHKIWTRPVHLETMIDEKKRLLSFDGRDFSERRID